MKSIIDESLKWVRNSPTVHTYLHSTKKNTVRQINIFERHILKKRNNLLRNKKTETVQNMVLES